MYMICFSHNNNKREVVMFRNNKGQTAVEYGLILAGVTLVIFMALNSGLSDKFKQAFSELTNYIVHIIAPNVK